MNNRLPTIEFSEISNSCKIAHSLGILLFLIVVSLCFSNVTLAQAQLGEDIDGEAANDSSGSSVSLSADGQRLAIGASGNDGNGDNSGQVRVYQWSGTDWDQLGADIDGKAANDFLGISVSMSSDGNRLAITANADDDTWYKIGLVRVYQWTDAAWTQLGTDIRGEQEFDYFGSGVSLSSDGNRLAAGAVQNDGNNGSWSGHVRAYQWSDTDWVQLGSDIDGEAAYDHSGDAVSLSADGNRLAIGAIMNDGGGENSGHVRVYQWSGNAWVQLGADLDGEAAFDFFGSAVSLSKYGNRLTIGAYGSDDNAGQVRVYRWSGTDWVQLGAGIVGEAEGDESGDIISLSSHGNRLAIGAFKNDDNGVDSGHVRVYDLGMLNLIFSNSFEGN